MSEMLNVCAEPSSKVIPVLEEMEDLQQEVNIIVPESSASEDEGWGEQNPQDGWLPITESRKGSALTAAFHLLCSGVGIHALLLPLAFVSLGWFWSIFGLSASFLWQLYTIWLLVNLHESAGIRYSRFLHLSIAVFGKKQGKLLAIFPTMYLSGGTCVQYIITGGATMELLYQAMCENHVHCKANTPTGAEWFLVFVCSAIFIAHFFHNLNSLASVSLVGSVTALAYCSLLWALSVGKGRPADQEEGAVVGDAAAAGFRDVLNGIGIIALAFRGHNLVLEIQGTLPTDRKQPSRQSMWIGVTVSYLLIAVCLYPLAIVGYWAYGSKTPANGGILGAFTSFHHSTTSKYILGAIYIIIIINFQCAFQIYAMPAFDNFERLYTSRKNQPCPRWLRSAIKVFFGGLTYFIAVAFPFLASLGAFIGSIALPLTLSYPCLMWVAVKKPRRFSRTWCLNLGLGSAGIVLSILCAGAGLWSLIVNGLEANFFKPS